jgi:putative spermidine/putrescine transport system ATP-binding protein
LEKRSLSQLSGGEQQRVSLARALVVEPVLLLMDEPLGALDRKLREEMQLEIKEMLRRLHVTAIFVTHDQDEALAMADRVAVMYRGRIEQVDAPATIYENPSTVFCASFLGMSNILQGELSRPNSSPLLSTASGLRLACPEVESPAKQATFMIRPEKVVIGGDEAMGENCFRGEIASLRYLGSTIEYHVALPTGDHIIAKQQQGTANLCVHSVGSTVTIQIPIASMRWLQD